MVKKTIFFMFLVCICWCGIVFAHPQNWNGDNDYVYLTSIKPEEHAYCKGVYYLKVSSINIYDDGTWYEKIIRVDASSGMIIDESGYTFGFDPEGIGAFIITKGGHEPIDFVGKETFKMLRVYRAGFKAGYLYVFGTEYN